MALGTKELASCQLKNSFVHVFSQKAGLSNPRQTRTSARKGRAMPLQSNLTPVLDAVDVNALMRQVYPQLNGADSVYETLDVFPGGCIVRLNADERHIRPGGTVSGPSLFTLADIGGYACVLSHAGPDALSVTTNLNINFVRKAEAGPIDGHCRILKLGKSLMVFDVDIVAGPEGQTIAHATGTYSIPPKR
ncbi:uncharacterized protein (TIGR00369 family) [Mesorhizobium sp. BE184]|nr:uncharacterized protein (TIGR00369 family) [Mesorhizobium sp. BE184]